MTTVTCPDCARQMDVEDRGHEGVRVVLTSPTPPAVCCQKAATANYTRTGVFITPGTTG